MRGLLTRRPVGRAEPLAEARRGFAFTLAALVVVASILAVTYLPEGLVGPAIHARQEAAALLWPMRWGFYTQPADREFTVAYRERGGGFEPLTPPNVEHQWGLSRSVYGDSVHLVSTALQIPASAWHDCVATDIRDCSPVLANVPAVPVPAGCRRPADRSSSP